MPRGMARKMGGTSGGRPHVHGGYDCDYQSAEGRGRMKPWELSEVYTILHDRGLRVSLHEGNLVVNGYTFCPQTMSVFRWGTLVNTFEGEFTDLASGVVAEWLARVIYAQIGL